MPTKHLQFLIYKRIILQFTRILIKLIILTFTNFDGSDCIYKIVNASRNVNNRKEGAIVKGVQNYNCNFYSIKKKQDQVTVILQR